MCGPRLTDPTPQSRSNLCTSSIQSTWVISARFCLEAESLAPYKHLADILSLIKWTCPAGNSPSATFACLVWANFARRGRLDQRHGFHDLLPPPQFRTVLRKFISHPHSCLRDPPVQLVSHNLLSTINPTDRIPVMSPHPPLFEWIPHTSLAILRPPHRFVGKLSDPQLRSRTTLASQGRQTNTSINPARP